ncbi:hypothetical protein DRW03_36255 [Corallococcus sp. H22C18031201]|nr:hypothetical protein DRW03_36255 [Corallococcus sp. H22C18031201]
MIPQHRPLALLLLFGTLTACMEIPKIEAPHQLLPSDAGYQDNEGNPQEEPSDPSSKTDGGEQDLTSPRIENTKPINASTAVEATTAIELTFSEPISQQTFRVAVSPQIPLATPLWSDHDTRVTFRPTHALPLATTFTITVQATDLAGNALPPFLLSFTTQSAPLETNRPKLLSATPSDGAKGAAISTAIRLTFSEPMNKSKTERAFEVSAPTTAGAGTISWNETDQVMIFTPAAPLPFGTPITWTLAATAEDLAGNQLAAPSTQTFQTIQSGTTHISIDFTTSGSIAAPSYFLQTHYYNEALVGKSFDNQSYRLFLGFKLNTLPATTTRITHSQLLWKLSTITGNPFSKLGNLYLEPVDIGEELALSFDGENPKTAIDYNTSSLSGQLIIPPTSIPPLISVPVTNWTAADWNNRTTRNSRTQYRLRFENEEYDNTIDALISDAESSPGLAELVVTYEYQ